MSKNRGIKVWLPLNQASALVDELEGKPLSHKAALAADKLRQAIAAQRLGHRRRPRQNEDSPDGN